MPFWLFKEEYLMVFLEFFLKLYDLSKSLISGKCLSVFLKRNIWWYFWNVSFLFLHQNICGRYSLKAPPWVQQGTFMEDKIKLFQTYHQILLTLRAPFKIVTDSILIKEGLKFNVNCLLSIQFTSNVKLYFLGGTIKHQRLLLWHLL